MKNDVPIIILKCAGSKDPTILSRYQIAQVSPRSEKHASD